MRDVDLHCRLLTGGFQPDLLSLEEQERASRFRGEGDRQAFIARRVFLRQVLAGYLNLDPAAIELIQNEFGKPAIRNSPLHFNASHSAGLAVIAVSRTREVGIDVESIHRAVDCASIARHFFTPAEAAASGDSREAFFRIWTRKEAYIKALGLGLSVPLRSFEVSSAAPPGWSLETFNPAPGYVASLAAKLAERGGFEPPVAL